MTGRLARLLLSASAFAILATAACSAVTSGAEPPAEAPAAPVESNEPIPTSAERRTEDAMTVEIRSKDDFANVSKICSEMLYADEPGAAALHVVVHPGDYNTLNLTLGSRYAKRALDITIEAADPDQPPVFTGIVTQLTGRNVHVSDILYSGSRASGYALAVHAEGGVTLERVGFVHSVVPGRDEGGSWVESGILKLEALADGTRGSLKGCWFLGNRGSLLTASAKPGGQFDALVMMDCVVLGNEGSPALNALTPPLPEVRGCLVDATPHRPFLLTPIEAPTAWTDSTIVTTEPTALVTVAETDASPATGANTTHPAALPGFGPAWVEALASRVLAGERPTVPELMGEIGG